MKKRLALLTIMATCLFGLQACGDDSDNTSNENAGNESNGDNTGDNNNSGDGNNSGDNSGDNDNSGDGNNSGDNSGDNGNSGDSNNSGDNAGDSTGDNDNPGDNTGDGNTPGDNTGDNPDDNTGDEDIDGDKCVDATTLRHVNSNGTTIDVTCTDGCDLDANVCKNNKVTPVASCTAETDALCMDDETVFICTDYWDYTDEGYSLYIQYCSDNRKCQNGVCVVVDDAKCGEDYCKDHKTLVTCNDGVALESACPADSVCVERQCVANSQFEDTPAPVLCSSDTDCASDETCYTGLCYKKSIFDMKLGDDCDASWFQEYCKDGNEIKCVYNSIYRVIDETCGDDCDCESFFENVDIVSCTSEDQCGENETCYDNHCYPKDQFSLKPGDICSDYDFNLYCKDGHQYYCELEKIEKKVGEVSCEGLNGCSTYLNAKYGYDYDSDYNPINRHIDSVYFDAYCRGTSTELSACTQPGLAKTHCYYYEDEWLGSFSYSIGSVCVVGADGQMIYINGREENECDYACDNATGLCK